MQPKKIANYQYNTGESRRKFTDDEVEYEKHQNCDMEEEEELPF